MCVEHLCWFASNRQMSDHLPPNRLMRIKHLTHTHEHTSIFSHPIVSCITAIFYTTVPRQPFKHLYAPNVSYRVIWFVEGESTLELQHHFLSTYMANKIREILLNSSKIPIFGQCPLSCPLTPKMDSYTWKESGTHEESQHTKCAFGELTESHELIESHLLPRFLSNSVRLHA